MTGDPAARPVSAAFEVRAGRPSDTELAAVTAVLLALVRASAQDAGPRAPGARTPRWPAEERPHVPAGAWAAAPRGAARTAP
ncbi:acyl-CoA carboxylase epsilon subunit [Streptomyces sp. NRRL B-24085]|uniref:acyl-CoA carboxylase epsilon subunit n=1 Tax=Streptomyces sp. NRRL B-24085 TaxID=1709476 RepID=UPI0006B38FDF|nr:acyl-CoA carboxylase epsilon subunit [Streptomyces sp. NRRL B-24085]